MPLVNAKCTNCGANLNVDNTKDAAVCTFCGSAFIVEKAIKNYNYNITNNVNAQNVVITGKGSAEKERLLNNAKTNERFGDYEKSQSIYMQVTEDYPDDYRGWLGIALIKSENYSKFDVSFIEYEDISKNFNKALMCAPTEISNTISLQWNIYNSKRTDFINKQKEIIKDNKNKILKIAKELDAYNKRLTELNNSDDQYSSSEYDIQSHQYNHRFSEGWNSLLAWAAILIIVGIFWIKWLIAIGVLILVVFFIIFFYRKNILKGLKKKRHSISDLVDKTKTEIYNLTIEKNALEKETDDLKSRYNI